MDDKKKYPVLKNGLKSLFTIAKNSVKGIDDNVTPSIAEERMKICRSCPHFIKTTSQCGKCFCFLAIKTAKKQESCPIGLWGACENCGKNVTNPEDN